MQVKKLSQVGDVGLVEDKTREMRPFCSMVLGLWKRHLFSGIALGCVAWGPEAQAAENNEGLRVGDLVAICGDSITEHKIYSVFLESYLLMCQPVQDLSAAQFGWSGETSWGFAERIRNDVLPFHPSVATTCYGMNDGHFRAESSVRLQKYREATTKIVRTLKDGGVRFIVIGSPGVVDTDTYKRYNVTEQNQILSDLAGVAREVAAKEGVMFADVHGVLMRTMKAAKAKYGIAYHVAGRDGIHPAANGHLVMAYAFLKALGCEGSIGTISLDFATGKAEATAGQEILQAGPEGLKIRSSRYPFCFSGAPRDPNGTRGMLEFLPFNQELNRYLLVVKNPPLGGLRVTWGEESKEFAAAALEKGVNLAAEFPENPFVAPFASVQAAIKAKQARETIAVKTLLHPMLEWNAMFPEEKETMERLAGKVLDKWGTLRADTRKLVLPVDHHIALEPVAGVGSPRSARPRVRSPLPEI